MHIVSPPLLFSLQIKKPYPSRKMPLETKALLFRVCQDLHQPWQAEQPFTLPAQVQTMWTFVYQNGESGSPWEEM